MKYTFNRSSVIVSDPIDVPQVNPEVFEYIPNLFYCPIGMAIQLGGRLMRDVLETVPIIGDQDYVGVNTFGAYLKPGWHSVAPGWHIDTYPVRDLNSLSAQQQFTEQGKIERFHTIVIGNDCATQFLGGRTTLDLDHSEDNQLNSEIDAQLDDHYSVSFPNDRWTTWDWWHIHRSAPAIEPGWRLLIRVLESSQPPLTSHFVRPNNTVYAPRNFRRK